MENLTSLLVALHTLLMISSAPSLYCYECTNAAGCFEVPKCDGDNVVKRTYDWLSDRCMTMNYKYTFSIFQPTETKNCTSGLACDPQFDFSWCQKFEIPGPVSNCSLECCQGDLCNGPSNSMVTSPLEVIASFGVILWSIVLTMFVG